MAVWIYRPIYLIEDQKKNAMSKTEQPKNREKNLNFVKNFDP